MCDPEIDTMSVTPVTKNVLETVTVATPRLTFNKRQSDEAEWLSTMCNICALTVAR